MRFSICFWWVLFCKYIHHLFLTVICLLIQLYFVSLNVNMSHLFIPKSLEKEDEEWSEETIKDQFDDQEIDECGIYDFYPNASQNSMLDGLQTFSELFNPVNILLCHLQSPELVQFFSEETSRRDYHKFIAIFEKYHGIRLQIHSINKSAWTLLNKAMANSKKYKKSSYTRIYKPRKWSAYLFLSLLTFIYICFFRDVSIGV